jgi:CsoR family transcriptional regulator, copper-sensing transcriptional repressor
LIPLAGIGIIARKGEPAFGSPCRGGAYRMTEQQVGQEHGYIKAKDKEKMLNRLRRIEGQVRGVQRMVEEEKYCVDILTQISSYIAASEKVASLVLKDHMDHCVRAALEDGTKAEEKVQELQEAVERFIKLD